MAITFIAGTRREDAGADKSMIVEKPAGAAERDTLVAVLRPSGNSLSTVTLPSGWTLVPGVSDPATGGAVIVASHTVGPSDPTTWTFAIETSEAWRTVCAAFRGASENIDGTVFVDSNGSGSNTIAVPSITTDEDGSVQVVVDECTFVTGSRTNYDPPFSSAADPDSFHVGLTYRILGLAGPTSAEDYNYSNGGHNNGWVGTFALRSGLPEVHAGPDVSGQVNDVLNLDGTVNGVGPLTYQWSDPDGGGLIFASPNSVDTTVTGASSGTWTARLTATNDAGSVSDDALVTLTEPPPPAIAGLPQLVVELDSRTSPNAWTDPPTWTRIDATNGVRAISTRRGQRDTHGPAEPGEMVLALDNRNGYLDPTFPDSPYTDLLTLGRQLRVRSGSVEVFRGNVTAWPVTWHSTGREAETELVVTDILAELGRSALPTTLVEYEASRGLRYPQAEHLWPMSESVVGSGLVLADVLGGLDFPTVAAASSASGSQLVPFSDVRGIEGATPIGTAIQQIPLPAEFPVDTADWTIFGIGSVGSGDLMICYPFSTYNTSDGVARMGFGLVDPGSTNGGKPFLSVKNAAGTEFTASVGTNFGNDAPTIMVLRHDAATKTVRGDFYNSGLSAPVTISTTYTGDLDIFDTTREFSITLTSPGSALAMVGVWGSRLTDIEVANLRADIESPWSGHDAQERITELLGAAVAGARTNIDASSVEMLPVSLKAKPALDVLRRTAESAEGRLWATADGTVSFRDRLSVAPAAVRTYGVEGVPITGLEITDAREDVVTFAIVENEAGSRQAFHDTTASTERGEHRREIDGLTLSDPRVMLELAERTVVAGSDPAPHVETISLAPGDPAVGYGVAFGLDLYDRVEVAYERPWDGVVVSEELEVIAIDHDGHVDFTTVVRLRLPV